MTHSDGPNHFPKLRWPLRVSHQSTGALGGQQILVLQCPLGIADPLGLIPQLSPVLPLFDGQRSLQEIAALAEPRGVPIEMVRELVDILDSALYLENARFLDADERVKALFRSLPERPAALAGSAYPEDPALLTGMIQNYLSGVSTAAHQPVSSPLLGMMTPHIDYHRGGACYGSTFYQLHGQQFDLVLLLGTCHQYATGLFHLTEKSFQTPLGPCHTDKEFVRFLAKRYGVTRSFYEERVHRSEHSLELQLPFLKVLAPHALIVPILVGSFHSMVTAGRLPEEHEEYAAFVDALNATYLEWLARGTRILILAGVDMAHVGTQFGDDFSLSPERMQEIATRDEKYLQAIEQHDKKVLFQHIAEDNDARRICGFPTMYTILDLFDRAGIRYAPEFVEYRQAVDKEAGCAVTFAGMTIIDSSYPQIEKESSN